MQPTAEQANDKFRECSPEVTPIFPCLHLPSSHVLQKTDHLIAQ
jgi:hypothetical protein